MTSNGGDGGAGGGGAGCDAAGADESWLEMETTWESRLRTVEAVYDDRGGRYPKLPWHDDSYRRCEYRVDWEAGTWSVDDSKASPSAAAA